MSNVTKHDEVVATVKTQMKRGEVPSFQKSRNVWKFGSINLGGVSLIPGKETYKVNGAVVSFETFAEARRMFAAKK